MFKKICILWSNLSISFKIDVKSLAGKAKLNRCEMIIPNSKRIHWKRRPRCDCAAMPTEIEFIFHENFLSNFSSMRIIFVRTKKILQFWAKHFHSFWENESAENNFSLWFSVFFLNLAVEQIWSDITWPRYEILSTFFLAVNTLINFFSHHQQNFNWTLMHFLNYEQMFKEFSF